MAKKVECKPGTIPYFNKCVPKKIKRNGKIFELASKRHFIDRGIAEVNAEYYRKKGYHVRIIPFSVPGSLGSHLLYWRKKE